MQNEERRFGRVLLKLSGEAIANKETGEIFDAAMVAKIADIIRQLEEGKELPKKNYLDETSFAVGSVTPEMIESRQY